MINSIKKSFTLVEVLVSASILAVGLVSVLGTFSAGTKFSRHAKNGAVAAGILQEAMESAIALGYEGAAAGSGERIRFSSDPSSPFYMFEIQTEVSFVGEDLNNSAEDLGLKKIKAAVFWNESGAERKEEAFALMAR